MINAARNGVANRLSTSAFLIIFLSVLLSSMIQAQEAKEVDASKQLEIIDSVTSVLN